jgi:NAD(P)-dependent dehydrogenase (short-subunit alcohol dehydrogenase family)
MAATPLAAALGRLPDPRESAAAVAFLAMPAASYISGQTLSVDGAFGVHGFNGPCVDAAS